MATNAKVNIGVSGVSEFKRNMKDAESSVKALTSSLELNKKELEATGNKESYLKNQTQILKDAIEAQTAAVQAAESALNQMRKDGVEETSSAFSNMKKRVNENRIKLLDLKSELKKVETQSGDTSAGLENIGKNVAWDNVAEGIGKITDRLQGAARAAVNFGKRIGRSVMTSAEWADNLKTTADQFDITPERLQRMQNVADIIDTDVEAILGAQQRMAKATTTKKGISAIEETLGIGLNGQNADDLFWEIGEALVSMGQGFDKEAAAQNIFGRSWRELLPLFKAGREEYEKMIDEQKVMSDEDVNRLGALDDTINGLKQQVELMKNQFIADNADKIRDLLQWVIDNQGGVVAALTAIGGGFAALKMAELAANIAKVVSGLQGLGWIGGGASGGGGAATAISAGAKGGILKAGAGTLLKLFPFALPAAVAVDSIIDIVRFAQEGLANGRKAIEHANGIRGNYGNYSGLDLWEAANGYISVSGGTNPGEGKAQTDALVARYWKWFNDEITDASMDHLVNDLMTNEQYGLFHEAMEMYASGNNVYSSEERDKLDNAFSMMRDLLEEDMAKEAVNVEIEPVVPNGAALSISSQIGAIPVAVAFSGVSGGIMNTRGGNTYNNNTYFGNVNLNNGMDIDNLVHSIDRNNRRKNAGYGG